MNLRRTLHLIVAGVILAFVDAKQAPAFSLLGPLKPWQVPAIGYDLQNDIGGPMFFNEAYRWNVPNLVYAFDQTFLSYFGPEGVAEIEEVMTMLNRLPRASAITNDGSSLFVNGERVPFDTKRVNHDAQQLGLLDIKSVAMRFLLEELGLAESERWVFGLRAREITDNGNVTNYTVIPMNYDPITFQPTLYVNNTLYWYNIVDTDTPQDIAEASEFAVDPLSFSFSSVSGGNLFVGEFYTGFTHDDIGGLRFLLHPGNFANENLPTNNISRSTTQSGGSPWVPVVTTNFFPGVTNVVGGTNINYVSQALRPGLDKLNFVRGNYDSLIGTLFVPITNQFTDRFLSNGIPVQQSLQRAILQPDILFVSEDLGLANDNFTPFLASRTGTANWVNNDAINGIAGQGGPGTITPPVQISYSNLLPYFINRNPDFLQEPAIISGAWGSFDGTTNAPSIYPQYLQLTLEDLRNARNFRGN